MSKAEHSERGRTKGRPPGRSQRGRETEEHVFQVAMALFQRQGFKGTTLRQIATDAEISVGLLYRYFPSKHAVVLALYERLTKDYVSACEDMPTGKWQVRALFALEASLATLEPHRKVLSALIPILVGAEQENLLSPDTVSSRRQVRSVFVEAVANGSNSHSEEVSRALGGTLYMVHLSVLLFWCLDRSPGQRATKGMLGRIEKAVSLLAISLRVPGVSSALQETYSLIQDALFPDD